MVADLELKEIGALRQQVGEVTQDDHQRAPDDEAVCVDVSYGHAGKVRRINRTGR